LNFKLFLGDLMSFGLDLLLMKDVRRRSARD
jgi:hypothetical protein